jgi:tRNA-(ms[2]io[6]A)-hydroxylase
LELVPTGSGWTAIAVRDVGALLSDHAHCEKKAATTALALLTAHHDQPALVLRLARLAEQETDHLRRVLEAMRGLGYELQPDEGNDYARGLARLARDSIDRCIVAALIEARSHERLALLTETARTHPELGALHPLLDELRASEAGHAHVYLELACALAGRDEVARRLPTWCEREAAAIASAPARSAVH